MALFISSGSSVNSFPVFDTLSNIDPSQEVVKYHDRGCHTYGVNLECNLHFYFEYFPSGNLRRIHSHTRHENENMIVFADTSL